MGHRLWEKPRGERQTCEGPGHEPGDTWRAPELGEAGGPSSSHCDLGCLAPRTGTGNTSVVPQPAGLASAAAGLGRVPDGGGPGPHCAPAPCDQAPSRSHVPAGHKHLSPGRETVGRRSERPGRHLVCPRRVPDTCGPGPHAPLPSGTATSPRPREATGSEEGQPVSRPRAQTPSRLQPLVTAPASLLQAPICPPGGRHLGPQRRQG